MMRKRIDKKEIIEGAPQVVVQGIHYSKSVLEIVRILRLWKVRISKRIRRIKGTRMILKKFVSEVKKRY